MASMASWPLIHSDVVLVILRFTSGKDARKWNLRCKAFVWDIAGVFVARFNVCDAKRVSRIRHREL